MTERFVVQCTYLYGEGRWTDWEDVTRGNPHRFIAEKQYKAVLAGTDRRSTHTRLIMRIVQEEVIEVIDPQEGQPPAG